MTTENFIINFIYPILLSIIAGVIFWIIFSYIPDKKRYNKIRPKTELNLLELFQSVSNLINLMLSPNHYSGYSNPFKSKLEIEDFKLMLQNKVWNETYLYYPEIKDRLMIIGKKLYDYELEMQRHIDSLYLFKNYLTTKEILLLEKIKSSLSSYVLREYNRDAKSIVGNSIYRPYNPSLSFLAKNLYELNGLNLELKNIVLNNKFENEHIHRMKISFFISNDQYKACRKQLMSNYGKYLNFKITEDFYLFSCEYVLNKKESYNILNKIFMTKPILSYYRSLISPYLEDENIIKVINKHYNEIEFQEMINSISHDKNLYNSYIDNVQILKNYYKSKETC